MKKKSELKQLLLLVCMMAVAFIFLVPIIWMVSASFQGQGQIFKVPFNWIPREASLKNYSFAIIVGGLKDAFITSSISALLMISIQVSLSTVTGYVFSKYRFPGKKWLLLFKNETHNHPTEIEPFGGAATCVGGAIRDPLSGRSYVYAAMRVTGAGNPLTPVSETLRGKLPQRKIVTTAAAGYSSYGNQIGLATGYVKEIYHPGYVAKRMEIGAVIAAAPKENVVRKVPQNGDIVILLGGKTGRDGCGGATGSSKEHSEESILTCSAEVQKGDAPNERKIQRFFRNKEVAQMIKRCNDFGAGGVCVAVGELAPGLEIDLDAVLKKYDGLTGTELAISESQERMAIVVDSKDVDFIKAECAKENLEVVQVAIVTDQNRLIMSVTSISKEMKCLVRST